MKKVVSQFHVFLGAVCLFVILISNTASAQQLSGVRIDLDIEPGETLLSSRLSPDGKYIVYTTRTTQSSNRLYYSVPSSGGSQAVRLNTDGAPVENSVTSILSISPDSRRVLYISGVLNKNLYSVPIVGGSPVRLNLPVVGGGLVASFLTDLRYSPDGRKVIFRHTRQVREYELFSNNIEGGTTAVNLNLPARAINLSFPDYQISPDSAFIVYPQITSSGSLSYLFRTPVDGSSQPMQLTPNEQLVSDAGPARFAISSNSQRIVYAAKVSGSNDFSLYSQPLSGGTAVPLGNLVGSSQFSFTISISPDSQSVIVRAPTPAQSSVNNLYRIPISGGVAMPIRNASSSSQPLANRAAFFSKDGRYFFYATSDNRFYSYSMIGGTTALLSSNASLNYAIEANDISRLIFVGQVGSSGVSELYSVRKSGGGLLKLNNELGSGDEVRNFSFLFPRKNLPSERNLLAFRVTNSGSSQQDLFITSPNERDLIKIGSGFIRNFEIFNDAIFYLSDELVADQFEWYRAEIPAEFGDNSVGDFCLPIKTADGKIAVICL